MVYCEGVEVESRLGKFIQAFRCDRPDEWTMDEFIRKAEEMHAEIIRLREAERDAERYRWLRDYGRYDYYLEDLIGENHIEAAVDARIDNAMKEKCDE